MEVYRAPYNQCGDEFYRMQKLAPDFTRLAGGDSPREMPEYS